MKMKTNLKVFSTVAFISIVMAAPFSQAQDKMKTKKEAPKIEWTNLQRENMAKMHEDMANCLRSSKTPSECRADMRSACKSMGKNGCPMMEGKKHQMMDYEY